MMSGAMDAGGGEHLHHQAGAAAREAGDDEDFLGVHGGRKHQQSEFTDQPSSIAGRMDDG